jgi:hypothetical protein
MLIEYGRIKDGSILHFARKLTAYHAIKMNEKQAKIQSEQNLFIDDDLDVTLNPDGSPAKKEIKLKSNLDLGYAKTTKTKFE